jgi:hypothetical protein
MEPNVPQAGFPVVSVEEAAALRAELASRRFTSTSVRLPDEVVPDAGLISIRDQGTEPVSVGVALAAVLDHLRARNGETSPVSARMLYEFALRYDEFPGTDYEGTSLAGGVAALSRHGVCLESQWPLGAKGSVPPAAALEAALANRPQGIRHVAGGVEELKSAVFEHRAVAVAATLHEGWDLPVNGAIQAGTRVQGGHAFAVVGYTRAGFVVQNSWGPSWGGFTHGGVVHPGLALWPFDDAAKHLVDAWALQLTRAALKRTLVGYDSDTLGGSDLLAVKSEVRAFSYVLASRAIKPPMALGLFGDWGSGKSFFMQEMDREITALASQQKDCADPEADSPFCCNIVQIHFNAWHYLDTDLWASLVTEIFDRLFKHIGGETDKPEAKIPQLAAKLQEANGVYQQAKQQYDDAKKDRDTAEGVLAQAIKAREKREGQIRTQLEDVGALLKNDPALRETFARLAKDLGVPELTTSYAAVEARAAEARDLGRRPLAILQTLFATPWGWPRLVSLLVAVAAPILIVMVIEIVRAQWPGAISDFHSFALQVTSLLGAITTWLGVQLKRGSSIMTTLENAHRSLQEIRDRRREQAAAQEKNVLQALKEREEAARTNLNEAEQRVQLLQREIAELQPGRLIMRFIEERSHSADYRSRLGIVSLVRRDFERLSELADRDSDKRDAELMPVERIVLYLDDLDRCKPERVIEVLEAVHLLLAFKLFMVVVAVDPRWLRHCLVKHYPDLLALPAIEAPGSSQTVPSRPATAQDYLEKIFQVPFSLQPMRDDGYRRMIRHLTAENVVAEAGMPIAGGAGAKGGAVTQGGAETQGGGGAPRPTPVHAGGASGEASGGERNVAAQGVVHVEDDEEPDLGGIENLSIRAWELEDMEQMALLFRTPRSVKRFVNTYRFLRAGVRPHEIGLFEGERGTPGTYRAAMLLLAVLVNFSNVAPRFLRRVAAASRGEGAQTPWGEFLAAARLAGGGENADAPAAARTWEDVEWERLCDVLVTGSEGPAAVATVGDVAQWIPVVARYSF